jgi:hypothetical protein
MNLPRFSLLTLSLLSLLSIPARAQTAAWPYTKENLPALTVVLAIDQCRGDFLYRYADLFLPPESINNGQKSIGGFNH